MNQRILRVVDRHRSLCAGMTRASMAALAFVGAAALATVRAQEPKLTAESSREASRSDAVGGAYSEGVAWLLQHQQTDGHWAIGADPDGKDQRDHNEVCVTAMAIRALLPGLRSERLPVAQAIRKASAFLEGSQQEQGRFGPEDIPTMMYGHAHALRALCAVEREWPEAPRRACIERGVAWALQARNPFMGWRYAPRSGENDSKITAVMLLALEDARGLGIEIDRRVFREAMDLLDQLADAETGRTGFVTRGQTMSRFTSKQAGFPGDLSEEPTAMHLLVLAARGEDLTTPARARAVALVAARPPEWDEHGGSIDLAYWQFGAELMAVAGGKSAEVWRAKLHAALLPHRITADGAAYWPAVDAWSHPGMEVYTTASALLAMHALR